MTHTACPAEVAALARMITDALRDADRMGLMDVGIFLDKALVELTGEGLMPLG